ncbi:MAG TPA: diguanylate cyclase [Acetivibrio sp.]|uniref:diguanylate cyclase n=1 Tax=Acetivibrio sp. TaxID=1872092 RepID=UPI002C6CA191|nr:diguanylate cyclase [Acetivibrio sp.]HOM01361.1 diguanylate cyclase [Acetivibrio sp.]
MNIFNNRFKVITDIKDDLSNTLYLVSDMINDNKKMAFKIISPELISSKTMENLKREFVTLSSLSHPNLMQIYGFGVINSIDGSLTSYKQYYCAYEYIKGKDLINSVSNMSFDKKISIILQICNALVYLHRRGFSFKNLDHKSIIIDETDGKPCAKLIGMPENEEIEKIVFRPKKISNQFKFPEDLRSISNKNLLDLYSLGVLIFYLLTGKNPNRHNFQNIWRQCRNNPSILKSVPENIDRKRILDVIDKLTSTTPESQYRDAYSVIKEIEEICNIEETHFQKKYFEKITTKTKLIGRDENINQLNSWINEVANNSCNQKITCITGEAGIGKTRLLSEFMFCMGLDKIRVLHGVSSENEENTFEPVKQILEQIIPLSPAEILESFKSELVKILPDEKSLKGAIPSPALPDEKEKLRLKVRVGNFISNVLEKELSVLIFDNAQWLDEASLELIDYLANSKKIPLCIVLSYRKESMLKNKPGQKYVDKWLGSSIANEIILTRFDFEETCDFIKSVLAITSSPVAFCTEMFRYTEGNPGFIIDSITALFKEGKLYVDDSGQWGTDFDEDADYSRLYIPPSMHEAVWKHINTLDEISYKALETISAFNMPVAFEIIELILEIPHDDVWNILTELISHQIIEQRLADWGYTYDYHSKKIKNEIYKKIEPSRKKALHRKCAKVLDEMYKNDDRVNQDELIYHYIKTGEKKKALKLIIESADRMLKLHINAQTMVYLKRGRQIAKEISSTKDTIKILLMMGELYRKKGENPKAFECYNEALKYAVKIDDKVTIAKVKEMIGALYTRKNDFDRALHFLNGSLELSKEIGYVEGYLEAVRRICWVYIFKRKNEEAIDMINNVLSEYNDEKYSLYHASLYNVLGTHYLEQSNIIEALNCYNKSIELYEKNNEKVEIAYPLNNIATVFAEFLNDNAKAREYFEKSLQINIANNMVEGISSCYDNLGETYRLEDNYIKALEYYFKCEEQARECELNSLLFTVYKNIMFAYLELCEYQKSYDYLLKVKQEMEKNSDRGHDLLIFYEYAARYYFEIGCFEEAKNMALQGINTCKKSSTSESLTLNCILLLSEVHASNRKDTDLLVQDALALLKDYECCSTLKERRDVLHMLAETLIAFGNTQASKDLLKKSLELSATVNTKKLEIEYLILSGICEGGNRGIEIINKALELNEEYKSLRLRWKAYKAIGDIYYSIKEKRLSGINYIKALDTLYHLVQKVPVEFHISFLYSHNREEARTRLLSLKADNLKEQELIIEKQMNNKINGAKNIVQYFFDGISFEFIFKELGTGMSSDTVESRSSDSGEEKIGIIEDLIMKSSSDYLGNLKMILEAACNLTLAETGYILRYNDKNELDTFVVLDNNSTPDYYNYIIERSNEKIEGIFAADNFDKKTGNIDIFLPKDIKAVICIPICSHVFVDKSSNIKQSKRKHRESNDYNIKGYIYLSTKNVFNKFSWQSFGMVKLLSKIAALQIENYDLKIISSTDKLTGAYTRKFFENAIETQLKKATKEKRQLSIVMIDIDKFKSVNDNYGHQKGDEILSNVGNILVKNIRPTDICCRYGGEEFVIILPDTGPSEAESMAERLRSTVEKARLLGQGNSLTISLGISCYPKHGSIRNELIEKADQALYHAKESGRNRFSLWNAKMKKLSKRMDKLAGIISGNVTHDQRNVLTLLEIVKLSNEIMPLEDKIYRVLGTIIDTFDAEYGVLITCQNQSLKTLKIYARKSTVPGWVEEECYNKKIVDKALKQKTGAYLVDWDNVNVLDSQTGEPILNSIVVEPIFRGKDVNGVLYLSRPINRKEYGFNELNFLSALGNIISGILSMP